MKPARFRDAFLELRGLVPGVLGDLAAAGARVANDEGNPLSPGDILVQHPECNKLSSVRRYLAKRNAIIEANIGLVKSVAKRQNQDAVGYDDLVQAGFIGLIRAVERYDPDRAAFSTYATWWIRHGMQEITRVCKDQITSTYKQDLRAAHFYTKHGRMPSAEELGCKTTDLTHEQVWRTFISLDAVTHNAGGEGRTAAEIMPDSRQVEAEGAIDKEELHAALTDAINDLPDSERAVIMGMYYGTESHEDLAVRARVAKETVRKRSQRALGRLRKKMRGWKEAA